MKKQPLIYVSVSAILFGISLPLAKLLMKDIAPVVMAGLLYMGAFIGLFLYSIAEEIVSPQSSGNADIKKEDFPWLLGAIFSGGIVAPICLMLGLSRISGFTASLLLNLEGVFTAVIAVIFFREKAGKSVWLALTCMTAAGIFLTWDPSRSRFDFAGPLLVTLAMIGWGIDNNLTRNISMRNPIRIACIKGLVAGLASIALAYAFGMAVPWDGSMGYALLLGSLSYGVSLVFFIKALEGLGSFRTGVFFSLAPFVGAVTSLIILHEWIGWVMFPATLLTAAGFALISAENHLHPHSHPETNHAHLHDHRDMHHLHDHAVSEAVPHVHEHTHPEDHHIHSHWPDSHHRHDH